MLPFVFKIFLIKKLFQTSIADDPLPGIDERDQEDLTPTADGVLEGPVIPEPDYDQSDPEYGSYNGSECSGSQYNGFRSTSVEDLRLERWKRRRKSRSVL